MHIGNLWESGAKGTGRLSLPLIISDRLPHHRLTSNRPKLHRIAPNHPQTATSTNTPDSLYRPAPAVLPRPKSFLFGWVVAGVTGVWNEYPLYTPEAYVASTLADHERVQ